MDQQDEAIPIADGPAQANPQAGGAGTNEFVAEFRDILKENAVLLREIKSSVEARQEYDASKQKIIDRLDEEMKNYRDNFILQSQKPVFIDLILLYDDMKKLMDTISQAESLDREEVLKNIDILKDELLEVLYRRDIELYEEHPERLDHRLHRTISTAECESEDDNNKVLKIARDGFKWNGKVLRAEEVIIAKYRKN
jgi:molecular chaperone GrpE (heat shock protein)